MIKTKNIVVQGQDVSLNHSGMVELTGGEMTDFRYVTDKAGDAKRSATRGARINIDAMKKSTGKDRHRFLMLRLAEMSGHLNTWADRKPHYIGVEDYALGADQGAHYMGEIGGAARMAAYERGIPFRLHDPTSMKMFVAHNGTAPKDDIEYAIAERWGVDFSEFNASTKRQTSEDLCDAYAIAKMLWFEVLLRRGEMLLSEFHEKEIRVFHRVTKAQPTCLLEREWIEK